MEKKVYCTDCYYEIMECFTPICFQDENIEIVSEPMYSIEKQKQTINERNKDNNCKDFKRERWWHIWFSEKYKKYGSTGC